MLDPLCCWDWGGIPARNPEAECPERISNGGGYDDPYEQVCHATTPDSGRESVTVADAEFMSETRRRPDLTGEVPPVDSTLGMVPHL